MDLSDYEDLMTPAQVARVLALDPKTVTRWARAGTVPCITLPSGHRRFRRSDVDKLLGRGPAATPAQADDTES